MKPTKTRKPLSTGTSAELALRGAKVPGIQRVNVDFSGPMLKELDELSQSMNISRQALIKWFARQGLDQHYLATQKRSPLTQRKAA